MLRLPLGKKKSAQCKFKMVMNIILMFHFNETTYKNWCEKILYPHFIFYTPNFTYHKVQKPPVKHFSRHTAQYMDLLYKLASFSLNLIPYIHILTHCWKKLLENIVEKGEIAQNEQFHLLPHCFLWNLYLTILL